MAVSGYAIEQVLVCTYLHYAVNMYVNYTTRESSSLASKACVLCPLIFGVAIRRNCLPLCRQRMPNVAGNRVTSLRSAIRRKPRKAERPIATRNDSEWPANQDKGNVRVGPKSRGNPVIFLILSILAPSKFLFLPRQLQT